MEKNQHNSTEKAAQDQASTSSDGRPGQQLPTNADQMDKSSEAGSAEKERHSESSFPREDGETLGTP